MTVDNAYEMSDLTEFIKRAAKAKYVSTIDFASAYWQVAMSHERKMLTSFRIRRGLFQWNVMPQGLENSSKTFHALMRKVLWEAGLYAYTNKASKANVNKMILSSQVTRGMSISVTSMMF